MKYSIELSGQDINLIEVALKLRLEAAAENNNTFWVKKWGECLKRINKKVKIKECK